jgi:hypothetical protein
LTKSRKFWRISALRVWPTARTILLVKAFGGMGPKKAAHNPEYGTGQHKSTGVWELNVIIVWWASSSDNPFCQNFGWSGMGPTNVKTCPLYGLGWQLKTILYVKAYWAV